MDDFQLLPDDQGWQETIHLKDEGHICVLFVRDRSSHVPISERPPHPTNATTNLIHLLVIPQTVKMQA